jgi:hypothetical protein
VVLYREVFIEPTTPDLVTSVIWKGPLMLRRLFFVVAACLAAVVPFATPASADAPEVATTFHVEGPDPF